MASPTLQEAPRTVLDSVGRVWDRLTPVRRRVRRRLEVDTRALAALRMTLGLTLLIDLVHRSRHIRMFYTDDGVYPLSAYEFTYTSYTGDSIHALSGSLWFQQLLFVIAGLFAVAFLLGYRTRLVGLVSVLLLFSLHARNPGVLNGGDRLLRVIILVSLVAPLGERWSIDALRRRSAREQVASPGTVALLVQPIAVFTANAILKHRGENWYAGNGLEIAMANDVMTVHLGNVIAGHSGLLTLLNYGWVTLLAGSSVFLLLSAGRPRAFAALAYIGAFAGMLLTMAVGVFPLALSASVIPFLTPPFWNWLGRRVPDRWGERLPTAAQLGPLGRPPVERRLLGALRDRGFTELAAGTVTVARASMAVAGIVVLAWILVFTASDVTGRDVPDALDREHAQQQSWGLYAPDPSEAYSWYPVEAGLANGTAVDAFGGGTLSFDRPPDASKTYETFRHRKYMQRVRDSGKDHTSNIIAKRYADWACRRANATYDSRVERITVYRMYQPSPIDGEFEEPRRITVIERYCDSTPAESGDWGSFDDGDDTQPPGGPSQAEPGRPRPGEHRPVPVDEPTVDGYGIGIGDTHVATGRPDNSTAGG